MRKVTWTDKSGYRHAALVRDSDSDDLARDGHGINLSPPDVQAIDWSAVKRELHNQLVNRSLITPDDVLRAQTGVTAAVLSALRPHVLKLYREDYDESV